MRQSSAARPPPRNLEDETCSIASPHQSLIAGSIAVDEFVCPSTGNRFPTSLNFAPDHTSLADLACYLETESELSCGSPDFDLITEVSDAVCEPGCGFGRVATGEVFGAEVLVVSAVAQHVVDRGQDRRGHRDGRLLGTAACFETQELSLQIAILLARCAPGGLQQYRLEPWRALFDPRRAALAGTLVKARNESGP